MAWWFAHVAIEGTLIHVSDSEHEALRQKVLATIRGGAGGKIRRRDLVRKVRVPARELDDIMKSLMAAELVLEVTERQKSGPPVLLYMALAE